MLLKNKNVIITGSNRGIGKAILTNFAENGANIWACVRSESEDFFSFCKEIGAKYEVNISPLCFDLTDQEAMKKAIKNITAEKKTIDVLVNNAGIVPVSRLFQMSSIEEMKRVFEVNFFSQMLLTQYVSRVMARQKKGSIVNMVSIAALDGEPAQVEYVASKAALVGATKKLASELGMYGIRVNAVAPGVTATDMIKEMKEELLQKTLDSVILKRLAKPEEIANGVLFLASDLSSYMTGQILRVDGGVVR